MATSPFRLVYQPSGRYVNDHCLLRGPDGLWHLFHIVGPGGRGCYDADAEISFGHAVSADLLAWEPCPDVLEIDPASRHEPHHLFAPFVIEHAGVYYLFYSGINTDLKMESMCLATSRDLYAWEKHPHNPIYRPSTYWAEYRPGSGTWACCRDPFVLPHPEYGFIMYYVTWVEESFAATAVPLPAPLGPGGVPERSEGGVGLPRLVALGAATSDNLVSWQDAGPVLIREFASDFSTTSMESPCVVHRDGLYYLFYKHRDGTRLAISDDPLRFTDKEDAPFSPAHAAKVCEAEGRWYMSHCSRELEDVGHQYSDRTKGLYLAGIEWAGCSPHVVPL